MQLALEKARPNPSPNLSPFLSSMECPSSSVDKPLLSLSSGLRTLGPDQLPAPPGSLLCRV